MRCVDVFLIKKKNIKYFLILANLSFIESRIQMPNSIIPKGIFNKYTNCNLQLNNYILCLYLFRTSNDCVKYAKQTKTLYKLLINV